MILYVDSKLHVMCDTCHRRELMDPVTRSFPEWERVVMAGSSGIMEGRRALGAPYSVHRCPGCMSKGPT